MTKGKLYGSRVSDHAIVHLGLNVSSSAHNCGCVVDGGNTGSNLSIIIIIYVRLTLATRLSYRSLSNINSSNICCVHVFRFFLH